jgi:outer membrane lipoprotein-sorting protein
MKIVRHAALIACSVLSLHAADDPLQRFHRSYRGLSAVSFSFRDKGGHSGHILAKRGGAYRITLGDRSVVSDGRTVWNATASTKTVVINDYKPQSTDVSIERVFFDVMSVYRSSIARQLSTGIVVRLEAPNPQAQIANISAVEISCTPAMAVTNVRITSSGSTSDYSISKFKSNPPTMQKSFQYVVPKGWQTVDIR